MATAYRPRKRASTSASEASVGVDTSQLESLGRDLLKLVPDTKKAISESLRRGGRIVAGEAEARARYSKRIPSSIRVRLNGVNVRVEAGGDAAPNAAPIENRGKGHVRHPVFIPASEMGQYRMGNKLAPGKEGTGWGPDYPFTAKNSHPAFLAPALDATIEAVTKIVERTTQAAFDELGLPLE